jgi:hypothetical protein
MNSVTEHPTTYALDEALELSPTKWTTGGATPTDRGTTAGASAGIEGALEWFSDLPRVVILAMLWVMGAALLGSGALVVYLAGRVLVLLVAGAA